MGTRSESGRRWACTRHVGEHGGTHVAVNEVWDLLGEEGANDDVRRVRENGGDHGLVGQGELGRNPRAAHVGEVGLHALRERVDGGHQQEDTPLADVARERVEVGEHLERSAHGGEDERVV